MDAQQIDRLRMKALKEIDEVLSNHGDLALIDDDCALLRMLDDLPFTDWPGDDESSTVTDSVTSKD